MSAGVCACRRGGTGSSPPFDGVIDGAAGLHALAWACMPWHGGQALEWHAVCAASASVCFSPVHSSRPARRPSQGTVCAASAHPGPPPLSPASQRWASAPSRCAAFPPWTPSARCTCRRSPRTRRSRWRARARRGRTRARSWPRAGPSCTASPARSAPRRTSTPSSLPACRVPRPERRCRRTRAVSSWGCSLGASAARSVSAARSASAAQARALGRTLPAHPSSLLPRDPPKGLLDALYHTSGVSHAAHPIFFGCPPAEQAAPLGAQHDFSHPQARQGSESPLPGQTRPHTPLPPQIPCMPLPASPHPTPA
uniref:Uncharacterized protein n=1 Tax=Auxenochlorella protothecoides TaxID=3075 RepID=A0A1D1ZVK1_AUXPR